MSSSITITTCVLSGDFALTAIENATPKGAEGRCGSPRCCIDQRNSQEGSLYSGSLQGYLAPFNELTCVRGYLTPSETVYAWSNRVGFARLFGNLRGFWELKTYENRGVARR